jgi:hypothetical protein
MRRGVRGISSAILLFFAFSCSKAPVLQQMDPDPGEIEIFPPDSPWHQDISTEPVDPNSDILIARCGSQTSLHADFGTIWDGRPNGIPYTIVTAGQAQVSVSFSDASESDPGPYPVPSDAPIEGGAGATGDRHVIVLDRDNLKLYEMFAAYPQSDGSWQAGSGAVFDLTSNALRPAGWTSADAAGLPIFPGLVRYDEAVTKSSIAHALRFTCANTRRGYVSPARHFASTITDPSFPPMGMRVRLRADFDLSAFAPEVQVILAALKKYGMFLADNGSGWYLSGAPDMRWSDDHLGQLQNVPISVLEVVQLGTITTMP